MIKARLRSHLGPTPSNFAAAYLQVGKNLSDLNSVVIARAELGLGTIALLNIPPASSLLGSSGANFTLISLGSGLNLSGGVLSSTGGGGGIPAGSIMLIAPVYAVDSDTRTTPQTITLRAAQDDGEQWRIKDAYGNARANNITVNTTGGVNIDGGNSTVINQNYGSLTFRWNAGLNKWLVE